MSTYEHEKSPEMRSPRRRTTLRTAAVVAGAAVVLALPVGSAFADSPAAPEPAVTPSVQAYVTTVKLADGSVAKVYKFGDGHFEADVFSGDVKLDTLVSKGGAAAYGQNNGLHVVLQPNGTVTSWVEGVTPKPKPQPTPKPKPVEKVENSVQVAMPDGRNARLIDGPNGKRVEISMPNGNLLGTIDLKHPNAVNDGWTYKLVQDGKRVKFVVIDGKNGGNSWVYDFATGKLIERYEVSKDGKQPAQRPAVKPVVQPVVKPVVTDAAADTAKAGDRVVPKGGVKAGAEGVVPVAAAGDDSLLLAAGGGMAALGAAGLGFAMLRRSRSDRS
ncbi:hypothetical protein ACODT3_17380 [Streptomyces sp. 4.24]|uniref:hypothetical protein n=1 Tax=Streptomyces tritrimontium TaxID=3406573 RepID=UPI003BB4B49C